MTPRWAPSSEKHGVPRDDQVHVLLHPTCVSSFGGSTTEDGTVVLYIGHPHGQTEREVGIRVRHFPAGREALVFHAMPPGPKYRHYREEHPDDRAGG
jgi:hypothetical protein